MNACITRCIPDQYRLNDIKSVKVAHNSLSAKDLQGTEQINCMLLRCVKARFSLAPASSTSSVNLSISSVGHKTLTRPPGNQRRPGQQQGQLVEGGSMCTPPVPGRLSANRRLPGKQGRGTCSRRVTGKGERSGGGTGRRQLGTRSGHPNLSPTLSLLPPTVSRPRHCKYLTESQQLLGPNTPHNT
jgi:hypothetical protein